MLKIRFIFVLLHFLSIVILYMCRVNMSVALLSMVNSTMFKKVNVSSECKTTSNDDNKVISNNNHGSFLWNDFEQSLVLSLFYWGYSLLQIPAGMFTVKFSGKLLNLLTNLFNAIFTFLCPLAAHLGVYYLIVARLFLGLSQSPMVPAFYGVSTRWLMRSEATFSISFIMAGSPIGTIIGQSLSGVIADTIGWQYIFYIMGGLNFIWCIVYFIIITDSPVDNRFMSKSEKQLLIDNIPQLSADCKNKNIKTPWLKIYTSKVVICFSLLVMSYNFFWYILINSLPYYVGLALGFPLINNGFISSLPYLIFFISSILSGYLLKHVERRKWISLTNLRKFGICIPMFSAALFLCLITSAGCNASLAITFICLSLGVLGLFYSTISTNYMEVAPTLCGVVSSLPNTLGNFMGFVSPLVKNAFTKTGETRANWSNIFYTSGGILALGGIAYGILGTAEVQEWDMTSNSKDKEEKEVLLKNSDESGI